MPDCLFFEVWLIGKSLGFPKYGTFRIRLLFFPGKLNLHPADFSLRPFPLRLKKKQG
jgi:hypothetical protein